MQELIIDPEFRDKIPRLTEDEIRQLRENILTDGEVRDPIVVWNGTIIDGHNRWSIIQEHPELPYTIKEMNFPDRWAAIVWICRNQMGRRNITDAQRNLLIGEAYRAQRKSHGASEGFRGNQYTRDLVSGQNGHLPKTEGTKAKKPITRDIIAAQFNTTPSEVRYATEFLSGVESAENVSPGFREAVVSGDIKASNKVIRSLPRLDEQELVGAVEAIKAGDKKRAKAIVKEALDPEPSNSEFTPDDMRDLLEAATRTLDTTLRLHLTDTHPEILDMEAGRTVVRHAIFKIREIASKYENIVADHEGKEI